MQLLGCHNTCPVCRNRCCCSRSTLLLGRQRRSCSLPCCFCSRHLLHTCCLLLVKLPLQLLQQRLWHPVLCRTHCCYCVARLLQWKLPPKRCCCLLPLPPLLIIRPAPNCNSAPQTIRQLFRTNP
jgi:hypothetical protein